MSAFKHATIPINPFRISHSTDEIDSLKTLLRLSPLGPDTFENGANRPSNMGIDMRSMRKIRDDWLAYDWSKTQDELNALPQFMAQVQDKDPKTGKEREFNIHFIGYESGKAGAIPVLLLHGWPGMGCFELAPMVEHLQKNAKQPLDIIIPSLPGYMYSSPPPIDGEFDFDAVARVMHNFMLGLGYKFGYATQGGDLGALVSRYIACRYDECKTTVRPRTFSFFYTLISSLKVNFLFLKLDAPALRDVPLTDTDKAHVARYKKFGQTGMGYAMEHGTRPSTIGFAVASSPLALASWIGEKIIDSWSSEVPTSILMQWLTLFWLTQSFPTSIYMYRRIATLGDFTRSPTSDEAQDFTKPLSGLKVDKKIGYSTFPKEIFPVPKVWAEKTGDLVFYRLNKEGGHFAGLENPELLAKDFAEFLEIAWLKSTSKL
ncbi:hypothetical protein QFC20_006879 [Naganishia adeliensis]|uniref:Uncharacterized protein n=1 Tax=Naganishia adeliensis TaxID=92952 RepID=A0ACC2V5Y0_9TREE|nr:hypothetical protein QFC20_006879 [Naganishia adeliensis]